MGRANDSQKPLISLIIPVYNESAILETHLQVFKDYLITLKEQYRWEMIIVNDGSTDNSLEIIHSFAQNDPRIQTISRNINRGLGKTLQEGIALSTGDYVITYDVDLSCSTDHIKHLLDKITKSGAGMVIASPTMKGGTMTNVPWHREFLSRSANRFLSWFSKQKISNFTCMIRVYQGDFIRSLNLRAEGMEIMPEVIYKTQIMNEKIDEIPAHLDWTLQRDPELKRKSGMKIFNHTLATMLTGFLLRPFLFFIFPGILLLLFALYPNIWMIVHFGNELDLQTGGTILDRSSQALALAYKKHTHTFTIGLLSLLLAVQMIALGFQSLQNKHYFEELFNLITKMKKKQ